MRRGGGRILTRTNTTIRRGRISNGVSAGVHKGEGSRGGQELAAEAHQDGRKWRNTAAARRSSDKQIRRCGGLSEGVLGAKEGGGRGLRIAGNSTSFGAVKLPQSIREETVVRDVTHVLEHEDDDVIPDVINFSFSLFSVFFYNF